MEIRFDPRTAGRREQRVLEKMGRVLAYGDAGRGAEKDSPEVAEMKKNRRVSGRLARTAASSSGGFSDIQFATGRPRDPLFYWRQNNLPYDFSQNEELAKVRSFCRLLYQTDPIIGSCVDIFSKFPVMGPEMACKDDRLVDFHMEQFFDEDHLDYEEFLVDMGREYYSCGEAWPFATFNEDLGIWDDEELLNPDDVKAERSPFLKEPRWFIKLPWTIRQILQTRQPAWEYARLIQEYPELAAYTSENAFMPVSNMLLRQLKFKGDTFNVRGIPLLTRAMRPMLQQEMLNTAMDAIADRLYTPLILCKLGASATDLGTSVPWIPTDDDLENFELALDAALAGDFRALIHNFAVTMEPVFGRENMPDLNPDFERIEDRALQVFGLSRTFLQGASGGETYAADALNKELVTMLMSVPGTMYTVINQPWRGTAVRTMEQAWEQAACHHAVQDDGLQQVIDLPVDNNPWYTISFYNGMGNWGKIRRIIRHWYDGPLVRLQQKWGEAIITPNHSVYAADGSLVMPGTNPEMLAVRHLNAAYSPSDDEVRLAVPHSRIEDGWARRYHKDGASFSHPGAPRKMNAAQVAEIFSALGRGVARKDLAAEHGVSVAMITKIANDKLSWDWRAELETGVQRVPLHQRLGRSRLLAELKGEALEAFLRFLGAWIAEGCVYIADNGGGTVKVSNSDRPWLEGLAADTRLFAGEESGGWVTQISPATDDRKAMHELCLSNRTLADWLTVNCGTGARGKRLPDFAFGLAEPYMKIMLSSMLFGDGSSTSHGRWNYHTASEELAYGVALLCLLHGIQYTVGKDLRTDVYTIREVRFYEKRPDEVKVCEEIPHSGWVYDFEMADEAVPNFTVGIGFPVVHNTRYQKYLIRHYRSRALIVAEAQEHYDYREHNGKRYVEMEEVLEADEETGEKRIVEQPKLLIPDLTFKTLNLKDEDTIRQFMEALRESGIPISKKTRTRNLGLDLEAEREECRKEAVAEIVAEQETRKEAYLALRDAGLPVPQDLQEDFMPVVQVEGVPPAMAAEQMAAIPRLGVEDIATSPNLAPTAEDDAMAQEADQGGDPVEEPMDDGEPGNPDDEEQRPEESDEERDQMPVKAAGLRFSRHAGRIDAFLGARHAGTLAWDAEGKVTDLTVFPAFYGRGIATALFDHAQGDSGGQAPARDPRRHYKGAMPKQAALFRRTARVRAYAERERIRRVGEQDQHEAAVREGRAEEFRLAYDRPPDEREGESWAAMPEKATWLAGTSAPASYRDPAHVGARREAALDPSAPLPDGWYDS